MRYSPAERRALESELALRRRCPSCNRAGGVTLMNREGVGHCGWCGYVCCVDATFARITTRSGERLQVATLSVERQD